MRRYDVQVRIGAAGTFELIKENVGPAGFQGDDYWNECFTWQELKDIMPRMKALGWKVSISPVEEYEASEKIHLFPFTYGINHEVQLISISGLRLILTRSAGLLGTPGNMYHPFSH